MKPSGVEWIGEIPIDWSIVKLKRLGSIQTGCTPPKVNSDEFYSDEQGILWIKAEDLGTGLPISETTEYLTPKGASVGRIFPKNTIYVCCIASIGKTGYSSKECSCNQQINGIIFNNAFWKYGYYMTLAQETEYNLNASGNVVKIINTEKQSNLLCPFPSLDTQQKIANYLDVKCTKIDGIIQRQRAVIEKLKEYKSSVITEAVTKGLTPGTPMKPSGVEFVGHIPVDWEIVRNKNVFICSKQLVGEESSNIQLLSLTTKGIKEKDINNPDGKLPASFDTYQYVSKDNIVMCLFDLDVSAVFSGISPFEGMISPAYRVLICKQNILPKFADYWFRYIADGRKFKHYAKNIRYTLSYEDFSSLSIVFPPYQIQEKIANYLDGKCTKIDAIISSKQSLIDKLTEYKKSLIYEVVTGKKEV